MNERVSQYNAACQRVNTAVEALRSAEDGADLAPLERAFNEAQVEAQRCLENLERQEQLDTAGQRFVPRAVDNPNDLGMDGREVRTYSLLRAINAAVSGNWTGAELEREASDEIARRIGRDPSSFFVPLDVQREQRDMTVGTDGAGGYLVGTDLRSTSFIQMQRNKMMLLEAGATVIGGLVGDVAIPRQTAGASFYWVAESGAPTESQQTIDQIALTPHTGGAFTDLSRKLLKQSSIDAENFVMTDLASICALGIDAAGLHGTGINNQPAGIAATTGIGSVAGGTNGLAPTSNHMIDLETEVAIDNADVGNLAYMTNAKVRGKLKKTAYSVDGSGNAVDSERVWDRHSPATPVNNYPCHVTNQVSSTLVKAGSGAVCSAVFFGNWGDVVIGQWGTLDILVDPYTGATSGTVRIVALQDVDIAVRHAASFSAMLDALTT